MRWNEELSELGFRPPTQRPEALKDLETLKARATPIGAINRDVAVDLMVTRLGAKRSAWNAADIRGEAEKIIASVGVVADRSVRAELAEDLTARALASCTPLLGRVDAPEHVRALTSDRVLAVESDLVDSLAQRAQRPVVSDTSMASTQHSRRSSVRWPERHACW